MGAGAARPYYLLMGRARNNGAGTVASPSRRGSEVATDSTRADGFAALFGTGRGRGEDAGPVPTPRRGGAICVGHADGDEIVVVFTVDCWLAHVLHTDYDHATGETPAAAVERLRRLLPTDVDWTVDTEHLQRLAG